MSKRSTFGKRRRGESDQKHTSKEARSQTWHIQATPNALVRGSNKFCQEHRNLSLTS